MRSFVKNLLKDRLIMLFVVSFFCLLNTAFGQMKPQLLTKRLSVIGYQVKSGETKTASDWEKEQFQMLSKTVYKIKRTMPLKKKLYPRFEVSEEVYANEEKAQLREKRVTEKPPNLPIEQAEYWLVRGFRYKNVVYFIRTDALVFYDMIDDFVKKLEKEVKK